MIRPRFQIEEIILWISRDKAGKLIDEFGKAHGDMAQTLRAELAKFKSDLDAAEDERKKTDQGEVKQRRVNIENLLSDFDNVHQEDGR